MVRKHGDGKDDPDGKLEGKKKGKKTGLVELFNLANDPYEKTNLAALKPGDKINFPTGIATVIAAVTTPGFTGKGGDLHLSEMPGFELERADGKRETVTANALLYNGTLDTMDPIGRCAYCGKYRPPTELKKATIFVNRGQREGTYCYDNGCAAYDQMAAEG